MALDLSRWKRLYGGDTESWSNRAPAPTPTPQPAAPTMEIRFETEERVSVVGESHYQPAIRAACGAKVNEEVLFECFAELVPEPTNPYDSNAVRVDIEGRKVGYLSRADAVTYGPSVAASIDQQGTGLVRAVIAGHKDGETPNLGVFLHLRVSR